MPAGKDYGQREVAAGRTGYPGIVIDSMIADEGDKNRYQRQFAALTYLLGLTALSTMLFQR